MSWRSRLCRIVIKALPNTPPTRCLYQIKPPVQKLDMRVCRHFQQRHLGRYDDDSESDLEDHGNVDQQVEPIMTSDDEGEWDEIDGITTSDDEGEGGEEIDGITMSDDEGGKVYDMSTREDDDDEEIDGVSTSVEQDSNPRVDYRRLIMDSDVYKWERKDGDILYCLAPKHYDVETLERRKDLRLATLQVTPVKGEIHSANVTSPKFGQIHQVCRRLCAAALKDIGSGATARSSLHGLAPWVKRGLRDLKHPIRPILAELDPPEFLIVEAFATGYVEEAFSEHRFELWAQLATKFVDVELGGEPTLYRLNGGRVIEVKNHADMSPEGRRLAGGAIAIFDFPALNDFNETIDPVDPSS